MADPATSLASNSIPAGPYVPLRTADQHHWHTWNPRFRFRCLARGHFQVTHSLSPRSFSELNFLVVLLVTLSEVQTTWFNSWYRMIQNSKCAPSLNHLIYYSFWERSREGPSVCAHEGVVIWGLIQWVWRCVRPSYNWLPPHYFQQMVLSFSCHFKMETTALLRTFVLSFSPSQCSLPHFSQVDTHHSLLCFFESLSWLFFFLSLLLFLPQNIQKNTQTGETLTFLFLCSLRNPNQKRAALIDEALKGDMIQTEPTF